MLNLKGIASLIGHRKSDYTGNSFNTIDCLLKPAKSIWLVIIFLFSTAAYAQHSVSLTAGPSLISTRCAQINQFEYKPIGYTILSNYSKKKRGFEFESGLGFIKGSADLAGDPSRLYDWNRLSFLEFQGTISFRYLRNIGRDNFAASVGFRNDCELVSLKENYQNLLFNNSERFQRSELFMPLSLAPELSVYWNYLPAHKVRLMVSYAVLACYANTSDQYAYYQTNERQWDWQLLLPKHFQSTFITIQWSGKMSHHLTFEANYKWQALAIQNQDQFFWRTNMILIGLNYHW